MRFRQEQKVLFPLLALFFGACADGRIESTAELTSHPGTSEAAHEIDQNLFFIGQDLDAIRSYMNSGCCVGPDGATAYVGLYNVLSEELDYGGLGLDPNGAPIDHEGSWGAGPVSAYKTAVEFGARDLAIGLFIAENDRPNALSELLAGEHDNKIRHLAKLFQFVDGKVYLRIGYEFDGVWNKGYENADVYKTAWRRIVDILRAEGADNVIYVWHASAAAVDDIIEKKYEDIKDWYPGDDYVDWLGLSWFTDGIEKASVDNGYDAPSFGALADEVVTLAREKKKPVLVAETAPQAFDIANLTTSHHIAIWDGPAGAGRQSLTAEQIWSAWFEPFFEFLHENDDVIDAIAYINANWEEQPMWGPPYESGYWGDSRIDQNDYIAEKWNEAIIKWRGR